MASQTTFVSEFNELLKRIEHILQEARRLPLTHRVLVDEEELRTLLNQIGHVLPEEMRQARWIVQERDKILAQAAQDAEQMREEARQDTAARAAESPWVQEAQVMAQKSSRRPRNMRTKFAALAGNISMTNSGAWKVACRIC